jgi:hypothetical protein
MGHTSYDGDTYTARVSYHSSTGTDMFTHDSDIRSGKAAAAVHEKLDPSKLNSAGKNVRESRDSKEHPNSRAIAVLFDVTGSMNTLPVLFSTKLNSLMSALVKKGYVEDPQILFGAIGDATCDAAPLQIGQFEAGNEMVDWLTLIYKEGGGGGQQTESYELAMYYMARHTELDCLEKRGDKGYLFIIGDETPYAKVKYTEIKSIIGDDVSEAISTESILQELQQKYEVFWIMPEGGSYFNNKHVNDTMKKLMGQNFLKLATPEDIVEFIVSTIGLSEGYDIKDIKDDLKDIGADAGAVDRSSSALAKVTSSKSVKKVAKVSGKLPKGTKKDSVTRV